MEWIKVEDELPIYEVHVKGNKMVSCLICMNNTMVFSGLYEEGQFKIDIMPDKDIHNYVTHWMYYPKPPEE